MEPREDQQCGHDQIIARPEQRTYLPLELILGLLLLTNADVARETF